jgi:hypothetical protein
MRFLMAGFVLALVLSLFGPAALQAAGDDGPGGGTFTPMQWIAGDDGPGGGS